MVGFFVSLSLNQFLVGFLWEKMWLSNFFFILIYTSLCYFLAQWELFHHCIDIGKFVFSFFLSFTSFLLLHVFHICFLFLISLNFILWISWCFPCEESNGFRPTTSSCGYFGYKPVRQPDAINVDDHEEKCGISSFHSFFFSS